MNDRNEQAPSSPGAVVVQPEKLDRSITEFVPFGGQDKIKLSLSIVQTLIAVPTKSGKNCGSADAMKFIAMCQARRLNPFEGDAFLIGYDTKEGPKFSLITAHQAFLKRAEIHPEYDGMKSGVIVRREDQILELEGDFYLEEDQVIGGWATVYFKNRKQPMHKKLRVERFRKGFGVWLDDAAGMICKCAEADALRSSFPTMCGGLYLRQEVEAQDVAPVFEKPVFDSPASRPQLFEASPTSGNSGSEPSEATRGGAGNASKTPQDAPEGPATSSCSHQGGQNAPKAKSSAAKSATKAPAKAQELPNIRELLSRSDIQESELIDYLHSIGTLDEGIVSVQEMTLSAGSVLNLVCQQWGDLEPKIQAWKESL